MTGFSVNFYSSYIIYQNNDNDKKATGKAGIEFTELNFATK